MTVGVVGRAAASDERWALLFCLRHDLPVVIPAHHAEVRLEGSEWVRGHLREHCGACSTGTPPRWQSAIDTLSIRMHPSHAAAVSLHSAV